MYLYSIFIESISGNKFIMKYLIDTILKKSSWDKLMLNQKYLPPFLTKMVKKF